MSIRYVPALVAVTLLGCPSDPDPTADSGPAPGDAGPIEVFRAECDNVNPNHCLLPWPSERFLTEDPGSATGLGIDIPAEAMPRNARGVPVDPGLFERFDGFSPATSLITSFAGEVDPAGLNGEDAIAATLEPSSTTVIVDAESGALVAHFAELDEWPLIEPTRAPLYLRPAARLAEGRRYVAAVQGLRLADGSPVEPSGYFRALRDGSPLPDTDVEDRRASFEEIFATLEAAGVAREGLIEAWAFTTGTDEVAYHDLLRMRDDAVGNPTAGPGRVGAEGLGCAVTRVEEDPMNDDIWRRVDGTITVPLYLEGEDPEDVAQSRLHRGAEGEVEVNGSAEVPFVALIPRTVHDAVAAGGEPAQLEIYGHGLFGTRAEVFAGWHEAHAQRLAVVTFGIDWWGMSMPDIPRVIQTLRDFSMFDATGERLNQGVVNVLVLARTARGLCRDLPEMQIPTATGSAPAYSQTAIHYYGNSLGGILGGSVAAVANDITRFVLGVCAIGFPFTITRSANWRVYGALMAEGYPDPLDRMVMLHASASLWDLGEPSTGAPHLIADPFADTAAKQILMQIGVGDAQVANVPSEYEARTVGLPLLTPSPREVYGLETTDGPAESALAIYATGAPPLAPGTRDPGDGAGAHEAVRRTGAAMDQIAEFVRNGQVVHMCDGPCDPE